MSDARLRNPHPARVILLGLDGFPRAALSPRRTPHLWSLGVAGGLAVEGGRAALPASTYPSFASLLTGRLPAGHRVWSTAINRVAPAWAGDTRVGVSTLFDVCRAYGLRSAAIQGDHLLHEVLRTEAADVRWPPDGTLLPGTPLDLHGYAANAAVRPHLLAAVADASLAFVFGHLNEVDSLGHERGPDHADTLAGCAETDAIVGEVVDTLRSTWDRTIVVVVSDHDMERRNAAFEPIDLMAIDGVRDLVDDVWPDGGAALVHIRPAVEPVRAVAAIERIEGIVEMSRMSHDVLVAGAGPGRVFRSERYSAGGYHGGPTTARPLAIVGGGHPAVAGFAAALRCHAPHLADWAPRIAGLLRLRSGVPAETEAVQI
jgi:Type I phosphodiesterase / nucleotide pyrophosphatase